MYREKSGFVQSLEFLKNSWNVPSNFSDLEKVWKIEMKSWKMIKSLKGFFLKAPSGAFQVKFFCLVKSYSILPVRLQRIMKKALFLRFFNVSTDHLQVFDNCESGKWNYCFGKSLGKVLNFGSKNLYKPWKYKSPKKFKSISKSLVQDNTDDSMSIKMDILLNHNIQ